MVNKFEEILKELKKRHGDVSLFAIVKMDDLVDKWTVVLSAPWIEAGNPNEIFEEIRQLLIEKLTIEEVGNVARIGIWPKTQHFIELLLKYQTGAVIEDTPINGNMVYKAHILESNGTLPKEIVE